MKKEIMEIKKNINAKHVAKQSKLHEKTYLKKGKNS